jgi:hypothetical protein
MVFESHDKATGKKCAVKISRNIASLKHEWEIYERLETARSPFKAIHLDVFELGNSPCAALLLPFPANDLSQWLPDDGPACIAVLDVMDIAIDCVHGHACITEESI